MKLFVANGTKQVQVFMYWVPESKAPRTQTIAVGGQIQVTGDLPPHVIDLIIEQHAKYGMASAEEVERSKNYTSLFYSVDKPVKPALIERALAFNHNILLMRGKKIREEAAVSTNNAIRADVENVPELDANLRTLEASVVEERKDSDSNDAPIIAEGVRVQSGPGQPLRRGPGRPREAA